MADHYDTLKVSQSASIEEIKRSYRQLALKYHPDKNSGSTLAEEKFRDINQAYQVLINPDSRARYDYLLNELRNVDTRQSSNTYTHKQESRQEAPPKIILNAILNLRSQLKGVDKENVNQSELYKVLVNILSDSNIDILLNFGDSTINERIISETSHFLKFLVYPYVEDISPTLIRLAGLNEKLANKLNTYQKRRFYTIQVGKVLKYGIGISLAFVIGQSIYNEMQGTDDQKTGVVIDTSGTVTPDPVKPRSLSPEGLFQLKKEAMINAGWKEEEIENGQLSPCFNVEPRYGEVNNYLDIKVGGGTNVAVKLMDQVTKICIRYVFINSRSTFRIQNIPEGRYYLKIAYGKEWLFKIENGQCKGKFIRNPIYEKGEEIMDFYVRQTFEGGSIPSFRLQLDVISSDINNSFDSQAISEGEFNQ